MKKTLAFLFALLVSIFNVLLPSFAETKYVYNKDNIFPNGDFTKFSGTVATYCNFWNRVFGSAFSTDVSFNSELLNLYSISDAVLSDGSKDTLYLVVLDGIELTIDPDYNIFGVRVNMIDTKISTEVRTVRIAAIMSAIVHDFTEDKSIVREYYREMMDQFVNFYSKYYLLPDTGMFPSLTVSTEKGDFNFVLWKDDNVLYFGIPAFRRELQSP